MYFDHGSRLCTRGLGISEPTAFPALPMPLPSVWIKKQDGHGKAHGGNEKQDRVGCAAGPCLPWPGKTKGGKIKEKENPYTVQQCRRDECWKPAGLTVLPTIVNCQH